MKPKKPPSTDLLPSDRAEPGRPHESEPVGPDEGIVDLHVHVFPPKLFEAVWAYFEAHDWAVHHQHAAEIAETLASHSVVGAVALSYPHKTGVARSLNRFMESLGRRFPIFIPFASVHVDDRDLRWDVNHALRSEHLFGFKFQPLVQNFDINDRRLDYLYQGCLEQDVPVVIHIGNGPVSNAHVGFFHFKQLMRRFPELRVCVPHMGAFQFDEFLRMLDDHPKMVLDTTMVNTGTDLFDSTWRGDAELLHRHSDRICFGSDWPNIPYSYRQALDSVARFPLPPEACRCILGTNAKRFLETERLPLR